MITREVDLLVLFGIDNIFGRVLARVLMFLLLCQPVYVAFGAEIESPSVEPVSEAQEEGAVVEEPAPAEDAADTIALVSAAVEEDAEPVVDEESSNDVPVRTSDEPDAAVHSVADVKNDASQDDTTDGAPADEEEVSGDVALDVESDVEDAGAAPEVLEETASVVGEDSTTDVEIEAPVDERVADDSDPDVGDVAEPEGAADPEGVGSEGGAEEPEDPAAEIVLDEASDEDVTDDLADATPEEVVPGTVNSENKYTFGAGDCTLVADGEFYCVAPTTERYTSGDPRVYAEKDREGDREIFYFDGVEVHRITNNSYDDFAPVFDDETMRIAWQASIHDRMQIMVYDIETSITRQVTNARENSSNPHILHDTLVWQQWVDTNWEVMMTDVDTTDAFKIERLTDNAVHDMFPQLFNGLVTWQREKGASWEVIVYDLRTGSEHALKKNEDTKYENPRFVLLFDSKHENGDVETVGYDLDTGEMMELGTRAAPIPADPVTPKDEVPDAPVQTTGSTTLKVKSEVSGDDALNEDEVVL